MVILILAAMLGSGVYAQQNAMKAMIVVIPVPTLFATAVSFGYERHFTRNHTGEIDAFYLLNIDEMGIVYNNYAVMPGYKYYFCSDNKFLNNIWLSGYGLYIYSTHVHTEDGFVRCWKNYFGGGASAGKRMFLNKKKVFFMDLGFGYSFTVVNGSSIKNQYRPFPRPVLQLGWVF